MEQQIIFQHLKVIFGNAHGDTYSIDYDILPHTAAQIWAEHISSSRKNGLRETERFYNFPNQDRSKVDYLTNQLDEIILNLQKIHPELSLPMVDRSNLQNSLNHLHFNFAHGHHVTHHIDKSNQKLWSDFNVIIHAIESTFVNTRAVDQTGLNCSRVVFTWNDREKTPIPQESYQDFTLGVEFGCAYANYSQVGRQLHEMFYSQDDQLADEHIQPMRVLKGDTNLWFGPSPGPAWAQNKRNEMKVWFEQRQGRFEKLGYFWNDPQLAIGVLPVASLSCPLNSTKEINEYVHHLSRFSQVVDVFVD